MRTRIWNQQLEFCRTLFSAFSALLPEVFFRGVICFGNPAHISNASVNINADVCKRFYEKYFLHSDKQTNPSSCVVNGTLF